MGKISTSIHRNAKQKNDLLAIENDGNGILFKASKNKTRTGHQVSTSCVLRLLLKKG
jgi:hypothetical protein